MPQHDLTSEELAMIREILQRHLPMALLGAGDADFGSRLNRVAMPDRFPHVGSAANRSGRTNRMDLEATKGVFEPEER